MSRKFLTSVDLNKNELQNAVIQVLASAPSTPVEGQVYYNSTDDTVYVRADGVWLDLGQSGGGSGDMAKATYDPNTVEGDAFDMDNMVEGTTTKILTNTERSKLSNIEANADVTDAGNIGTSINGASAKVTPVSADKVPMLDSEASNVLKYITYSNLASAIAGIISDSAPAALDTLNELAAALGDDADFSGTVTTELGSLDGRLDTVEANQTGMTHKYAADIGNGAATSIAVTHNLGSKDVVVSVRQNSDDAEVECDVVMTSTTQVTLSFAVAPASNALRVVVIG